MKVRADKSPATVKRHETCFSAPSSGEKSKIKYLRDRITCKLSPKTKGDSSPRIQVTKTISTKPSTRSRITSTLIATKDSTTQSSKIKSKTNISSKTTTVDAKSNPSPKKACKTCSFGAAKTEAAKAKSSPLSQQKRKVNLTLPKGQKLVKSPDLVSPNEVKKAVTKHRSYESIYKAPKTMFSSLRNERASDQPNHARTTLPTSRSTTPTSIRMQKSSSESIDKLTLARKPKCKPEELTIKRSFDDQKSLKKHKKDRINAEVLRSSKRDQKNKCAGKAAGAEIVKKLRKMEEDEQQLAKPTVQMDEIKKQRELLQSDSFFRHLLLRNFDVPSRPPDKHPWITEKTKQLTRKRHSFSEPSVGASRVYLQHIKPVTESKFRSLNEAVVRSRSISPTGTTQSQPKKVDFSCHGQKRSISLPPKLPTGSKPTSPCAIRRYDFGYVNIPLTRSSSSLARSASSLDSLDKHEYHCYIKELTTSNRASNKFKELSQFYSTLERMGQLERTTSTTELRPRLKSEDEIIDYDRWKEVRSRERAERELEVVYFKLKNDQKEKGLLFRPKDVEMFRWRRELDSGLRIKDKSVENIKEAFERLTERESDLEASKLRLLNYQKDTYKPHWRGSSVLSLANQMVEKRSLSEGRASTVRQRTVDSTRCLLTHGVGSRIWSSLSLEQVNVLRSQLSEIYGQNTFRRTEPDASPKVFRKATLSLPRSDLPQGTSSSPSENNKRQLSQSLGKEVLDHLSNKQQRYKTSISLVLGKETRGAIAAAEARIKPSYPEIGSPRTCYSLEMSDEGRHEKDKKDDFVLVLAKNDSHKGEIKDTLQEWAQPKKPLVKVDAVSPPKVSSTSETESGSTDDSAKTVQYVEKKDIQKKVQYFEQAAQTNYTPTIYKPASSQDLESPSSKPSSEENLGRMSSSHSYQDLKQLFGESELVMVPMQRKTRVESGSSKSTSNDSIYRSRSLSPYFGEAYSLVRTGDVSRLKKQFESLQRPHPRIRRWKSDSHLNRRPTDHVGGVDSLRRKYEHPAIAGRGRSRSRRCGVVSPLFLRADDRLMPHINIISKIATLYSRKPSSETRRSTEELAALLGCPIGEVEKLRQRFDSDTNISLMGHMFTSSPNIRELRDIAPHLAAEWTAHRYPYFEDNARSLSSPEHSPVRRTSPRPKSASPWRPRKALSSILKSSHRFPQVPLPRLEPAKYRSWWPPSLTHSRPSVTFKGAVWEVFFVRHAASGFGVGASHHSGPLTDALVTNRVV